MTVSELWPLLVGAAAVIFGAGQLVEKIRNNKYVSRELCRQIHAMEEERWQRIDRNLERIWRRLNGDMEIQ